MTVALSGRVVLVTGTTSGLGREIARVFTRRGAMVVGMARREEAGRELEQELEVCDGSFLFVTGDITRPDDCARAVEATVERFGRIDVLINNAANTRPTPRVESMTDEDWRGTIDPDLTGTFQMCRAVLPTMQKQGDGAIISVASTAGVHGLGNHAAYSAAKGGVISLTRVLAVENLDYGIRANAVVLGGVETEGFQRSMATTGNWVAGKSTGGILAKMRMQPESVAKAIALLCSEDAAEITGSTVAIDRSSSAGWHHAVMNQMGASGELPDSTRLLGSPAS